MCRFPVKWTRKFKKSCFRGFLGAPGPHRGGDRIFCFFVKVPKGGGVIFNPKIYVADLGPLTRALNRAFSGKKLFSEDEGG